MTIFRNELLKYPNEQITNEGWSGDETNYTKHKNTDIFICAVSVFLCS